MPVDEGMVLGISFGRVTPPGTTIAFGTSVEIDGFPVMEKVVEWMEGMGLPCSQKSLLIFLWWRWWHELQSWWCLRDWWHRVDLLLQWYCISRMGKQQLRQWWHEQ